MPASSADVQIQVNWNNYIELVSFTILCYDYLLTFPDETEYVWKRSSKSLVAILFYIIRYLTLLGNFPILVFSFWLEQETGCRAREYYQQFFLSIIQLVISVVFVVRIYAIYEYNNKLLALLICAIMAMVINGALQWSHSKSTIGIDVTNSRTFGVDIGCMQSYTTSQGLHLVYLWIGVVAVDFLVFTLTLYKTIQLQKAFIGSGLLNVLMRDGALYFGIITLTNCANILVFAFAKDFMKSLLAQFANVIASIMITRLMLNLRATSQDMNISQTTNETIPLSFASPQPSIPD